MKLSNIFLSTLAVLLCCTACSKDEESFKGKDADASLSIAVKAVGSAVTKGVHPNDENELAGEAKVNNLSVLVFDESGAQLIGYGWQATNSEGEASILNVPAMTMRAQIVIVSNTPENSLAGVTSYSDFESKLAQLADQSQSNLVMSSPVITTQAPLVRGYNYLGYASMGSENINGIAEPARNHSSCRPSRLGQCQDRFYKNTSAQSYGESGRSHDIEPEHGFTFFQP
ncbi:MAG: fimbrial protein [Parabacteroides merdae]